LRRNRREPRGHVETIEDTTVGIYIIKDHAASEEPEDTAIILEGVKVLQDLGNVAFAVAMLFGLMYAMNLSSTTELRYFVTKCIRECDQSLTGQLFFHTDI
uniref:Uncharacterized protein n=1 Tax=Oncorhynchus tshawytscha TaxID=74940 RepID=A0A8C8IPV6_ONCTS